MKGVTAVILGTHERKLDGKKRVIIPTEFRAELGTSFAIHMNSSGVITIYTHEAFNGKIEKLVACAGDDEIKKMEYKREIGQNSRSVTMDGDGRIILPQDFLDHAGITGDMMIIGCMDFAEIWSKEAYDLQSVLDAENKKLAKAAGEEETEDKKQRESREEIIRQTVKMGF